MAERDHTEYSDRMSASDAMLWLNERDPMLRSTIISVMLLDQEPDPSRIEEAVDRSLRAVPRLRQRVAVDPLGAAPPSWESDPNFELDYHVRHVRTAGDGSLRDLLDLAEPLAMQAFDKDRPLWEMLRVGGLADGRAALILKLHHAISDGVGLVRMTSSLVERSREPRPGRTRSRGGPPSLLEEQATASTPFGRTLGAIAHRADEDRRAGRAMGRIWSKTLLDPQSAFETARSIGRTLRPVTEPMSPIMRDRSLALSFDVLEAPLDRMKQAGKSVGGTLNDAFVGAVTGGLRRYHEHHDRPVDELRMTMPINLREGESGKQAGNQFAPARFAVPIGTVDPAARMRQIRERVTEERAEPALAYLERISRVMTRLPQRMTVGLMGSMLKSIDFVTSNVPGPPFPVFAGGAHVEKMFGFGPLAGAAVNVTLFSYDGTVRLGINTDRAAIPDPQRFTLCLEQGLEEILALT